MEEMKNMDDPLDFELEDPFLKSPVLVKKSRKKVIGLDDLLTDYYKEKNKVIERESKRAKAKKNYDSDEDEDVTVALLSQQINDCHNQMKAMSGEEEISAWGAHVFGDQKPLPPINFPELESCSLLQSFMSSELNSLVELTTEKAETFLEGLLVNGWLSKLVSTHGYVEKSIAKWTFNLMLYSPQENLRAAACDFWCTMLLPENKEGELPIRIEWFPNYPELRKALETYGFLFNSSSQRESGKTNSGDRGPPKNVRAWIKFIAACCHVRNKQQMFSASEAEELVEIAIFLCLDRQLQGLLVVLYEFMQSVISYFTDEEWNGSCEKIARSLASSCSATRDLNCLRTVECISGADTRSNHLRSVASYQILLRLFDNKVDFCHVPQASNEEEILNLLISINVRDKSCDLFKMYIYLALTENWLLSNSIYEHKLLIHEMCGVYLRNCSCQISSTDLRPYASKVRTKASYILHGTTKKK